MLQQRAGTAQIEIDETRGGRLRSVRVDGFELLVPPAESDFTWGCFPMVPFAGRVRGGQFDFGTHAYALPQNLGSHAIHGYGFCSPWVALDNERLILPLAEPWPFGGEARQRISLFPDRLELVLELHAGNVPMPGQVGWHPWFRKPNDFRFGAKAMYQRDDQGIPTGSLLRPPQRGPWDDCFTELTSAPTMTWSEGITLRIEHDCDHLVVYDEPTHATCVEPQTGPPNGFNNAPYVLEPGRPLIAHSCWRWS